MSLFSRILNQLIWGWYHFQAYHTKPIEVQLESIKIAFMDAFIVVVAKIFRFLRRIMQ